MVEAIRYGEWFSGQIVGVRPFDMHGGGTGRKLSRGEAYRDHGSSLDRPIFLVRFLLVTLKITRDAINLVFEAPQFSAHRKVEYILFDCGRRLRCEQDGGPEILCVFARAI